MSTTYPHPHPHPQPPSLPSPRAFMTSLFNTLTSTDSPSDHAPASPPKPHLSSIAPHRPRDTRPVDAGNRLRGVAPEKKALLMTLHVIFPPPLLLQALDLLDRGGVVKLILWEGGDDDDGKDDGRLELEEGSSNSEHTHGKGVTGSRAGDHNIHQLQKTESSQLAKQGHGMNPRNDPSHTPKNNTTDDHDLPRNTIPPPSPSKPSKRPHTTHAHHIYHIYHIHTPHPPSKRPSTHSRTAPSETPHTVHLSAWNCTCAAFTYSAYPANSGSTSFRRTSSSSPSSSPSPHRHPPDTPDPFIYGGRQTQTQTHAPETPMCKHLLACLLGERWGTVLGVYVRERRVGREEMAALGV